MGDWLLYVLFIVAILWVTGGLATIINIVNG